MNEKIIKKREIICAGCNINLLRSQRDFIPVIISGRLFIRCPMCKALTSIFINKEGLVFKAEI